MSSDSNVASPSSSEETNRRRMLALMGVGGAAALASVVTAKEAQAGHDGSNTFHLGEGNTAPAGQQTTMGGNVGHYAFGIDNAHASGGGIHSRTRGGLAAVHGSALDTGSPGLMGTSDETTGSGPGTGPGPGVLGLSGSGRGVEGHGDSGMGVRGDSESGTGVHGHSDTGTGGSFSSNAGRAVHASSNNENFAVGIDNQNTSEEAGGLYVTANGGKPVIEADIVGTMEGVAIQGVSGCCENFGQGPGTGVAGISGSGIGVEGNSESGRGVVGRGGHVGVIGESIDGEAGVKGIGGTIDEAGNTSGAAAGVRGVSFASVGVHGESESPNHPGVLGESVVCVERGPCEGESTGTGVLGRSDAGIAVQGECPSGTALKGVSTDGLALDVVGKARFSTSGSGVVPAGDNSVVVSNSAVTAESHVSATLAGNPGNRNVAWVERDPGNGFILHMTSAPPPQRPATPFTYLIVEPA